VPDEPYRAPIPIPPDPYVAAWADLRRRMRLSERAQWAFWIYAIPMVIAVRVFHVHFWPSPRAWAVPAILASLVISLRVRAFRCPHCRRHSAWAKRSWLNGPKRQDKCVHCGIAIGTPKSAILEAPKPIGAGAGAGAAKA
jgi:hypothetical protein